MTNVKLLLIGLKAKALTHFKDAHINALKWES